MKNKKTVYIALLAALSIIIHGFEFMIPAVTPWFKLGLANSVSLAVLVTYGIKDALFVTILRVLISSFIFGTFLSPTFFLSLSGGVASILVMGVAYNVFAPRLSLIGVSLLGGYSHILAQGLVMEVFFIKHSSVFLLVPGMLLVALFTSILNGGISIKLLRHLEGAA